MAITCMKDSGMNRAQHKAIHRQQENHKPDSCGLTSKTSPTPISIRNGQSVENVRRSTTRHWFAIRATRNRALSVYTSILSLGNEELMPYLPMRKIKEYNNKNINDPHFDLLERPVHSGLLFVFTTYSQFKALLDLKPPISGLTPYYDHFKTNKFGRNDYLTIPAHQMESFRIILESGMEDILTEQDKVPKYLKGDFVRVTGGPFKGVEGQVLNWKHQKRVFLKIDGIGCFGTAFVPECLLERITP